MAQIIFPGDAGVQQQIGGKRIHLVRPVTSLSYCVPCARLRGWPHQIPMERGSITDPQPARP